MSTPCRIQLLLFILISITITTTLSGQETVVSGYVTDESGGAIEKAFVRHTESGATSNTDEKGYFSLAISSLDGVNHLEISFLGFAPVIEEFIADKSIIALPVIVLKEKEIIPGSVNVTANRRNDISMALIPVEAGYAIPSVSGGIEAVLMTLPGVSSYNELSNQYSVRGGSYDENLIYIDGIEIYHPYLIRYGQQEGLSQINPDFVSSVDFSPGGFSAIYGDRMSSVLDVKYRRPVRNETTVAASLLTSSATTGHVSEDGKYYYMTGIRYKTNALLVKTLDEEGEFNPSFFDFQGYGGIQTGKNSRIKVLLTAALNRFYFIPESQTTTFGSIAGVYKLFAYFDGCEKDLYRNLFGTLTYETGNGRDFSSKISVSFLSAFEMEAYDINGAYSLDAINDMESDHLEPDSTLQVGVGSWLDHARNRLLYNTYTLSYKGSIKKQNNSIDWGISSRLRQTDIFINEWERVDSSGYTIGADVERLEITSVNNNICSYNNLFSEAYLSDRVGIILGSNRVSFTGGIRLFHDTFNNDIGISPRVSMEIMPSRWLTLYFTAGIYRQPVTGRELMQFSSEEAKKLTSQKSMHLATGIKYDFIAWDRPFRFTGEFYGKFQHDLIPYKVENVRISYFGGNIARGYTTGLDLRVNGEFVEGAESWFSLSLMKSMMEIPSMKSGWFPSPFDQRLNANIFFQDYLPGRPDFRAHVNIVFGTGVPVSPDDNNNLNTYFRMPSYRRIDIGFSKVLRGEINGHMTGKPGSILKEFSIGAEIFNLADIRNTISYTWISTVKNSEGTSAEYAVPNFLTRRRLNFRITAKF